MPNSAIETRHRLSHEDRQSEKSVLTKISQFRAGFSGTPREGYDAMTEFLTPIANNVTLEAVDEGSVREWWVRPAGASSDVRAILFLHGGAYMLGSAAGYRGLASQVASRTHVSVFIPEYALAPEHPFPAAYDDAVTALSWLKSKGVAKTSLVGDSAGGGLALAALGSSERDIPGIVSVVVFSPWSDLAMTGESFSNPETFDPVFQRSLVANAAATYLGAADPKDGRASPLYAVPDKLPPIAIQVGTDELLLDDSTRYAAVAAERGGEVRLDIYEGLHHVFQRCVQDLPQARFALDAAATFINDHW